MGIFYTSVTGNTKELALELYRIFRSQAVEISLFRIDAFPLSQLCLFDVVVIGTYTWGNGEIPKEMRGLYEEWAFLEKPDMVTAVFGTGDSFYPHYCGAVDQFRDWLSVHTRLAATLKVELAPQRQDAPSCQRFVESVLNRANRVMSGAS
jgi:flavodoxin I